MILQRTGCVTVLLAATVFQAVFAAGVRGQTGAAADRAALEVLHDATGGADWTNSDNWKTDAPLGAWHGVATDAAGRVTTLELRENGLTGPIPDALGSLENLEVLRLGGNDLTGPIPDALGSLANLRELLLGWTALSGSIPDALGSLANLERLWIGSAWGLSGPLPAGLRSAASLAELGILTTRACAPTAWSDWLKTIDFQGRLCEDEAATVDVAVTAPDRTPDRQAARSDNPPCRSDGNAALNRGRLRDRVRVMSWKPWGSLLRFGVVGLLVGVSACSEESTAAADLSEPEDGGAHAQAAVRMRPRSPEDEARARELAAKYAQQRATEDDRLRAEQGDADAQALLAEVYYNGRGVERDYGEALRWARLAAEQGNVRGQSLLGAAYYSGNGVVRDPDEAARWARLAAEQGDAGGQVVLGALYLNGIGVPQDDVSAYMWLTLAASDSGTGTEGRILSLLAKRMTPEQIAEAEARIRNWNQ